MLNQLNVTFTPRVDEFLKSYFDIYYSSVRSLLKKYEISDISLCMFKFYKNREFIILN